MRVYLLNPYPIDSKLLSGNVEILKADVRIYFIDWKHS